MHYKLIFRILGFISIFIGIAMLLPIPFSLYYGDSDYKALLISAGITTSLGLLAFIGIGKKEDLRPKEGFAVVALGWIVFAALGSLPFIISGAIPNFTDAFFETMSGFTTTGATILTDIESLPHGILFWRSLTHWIGGMGIILLSLAILPFLGVGGMQLFKAEVPGPMADKLKPRVTETAKILWVVYLAISAIETILLLFGGMNLFDALCHTFGTMATGGYSTQNTSIAAYNSAYIDYIIIIFMMIAGTNFSLHYRFVRGDFKAYFRNQEFRVYIYIIAIATVIIGWDTFINIYLPENDTIFEALTDTLRGTWFQTTAIMTTTGFGTADYEKWSLSSQFILFILMFIGGSAGSTGGGMKVMRVFLLIKFVYSEIIRLLHPKAVITVKINGQMVDRKTLTNIVGFFVLFMLLTAAGVLVLTFFGIDLVTSFGAVAATINNIGPGLGLVGPTDNYAFLPEPVKWLLSFFMVVGRLEVYTIIILFAPSYWRK